MAVTEGGTNFYCIYGVFLSFILNMDDRETPHRTRFKMWYSIVIIV